jgi:hypothetical protein
MKMFTDFVDECRAHKLVNAQAKPLDNIMHAPKVMVEPALIAATA